MRTARVVIDTSAFYAITSEADRFHQPAMDTLRDLVDQRTELSTTSYVLVETGALIHRRLGFNYLTDFVATVQNTVNVLWMDRRSHWLTWERMQAGAGSRLSFVDWSVIVMAEQTRAAVFTFDSDFASEGLTVIPARAV